jgi:hypothetical protein
VLGLIHEGCGALGIVVTGGMVRAGTGGVGVMFFAFVVLIIKIILLGFHW